MSTHTVAVEDHRFDTVHTIAEHAELADAIEAARNVAGGFAYAVGGTVVEDVDGCRLNIVDTEGVRVASVTYCGRPVVRRNGTVELDGRVIGYVAAQCSPTAKVGTVWGYSVSHLSARHASRRPTQFDTRRDAVAYLVKRARG